MRLPSSIASISLLLPLAFITSTPAANVAKDLKSKVDQACASDVSKFCNDVTKSNGHVMACLRAHDDKLSDNCSKQLNQAKTEWKDTIKKEHAACSGDIQKLCQNADSPRDEMRCLDTHSQQLSASCKTFRDQMMTG